MRISGYIYLVIVQPSETIQLQIFGHSETKGDYLATNIEPLKTNRELLATNVRPWQNQMSLLNHKHSVKAKSMEYVWPKNI